MGPIGQVQIPIDFLTPKHPSVCRSTCLKAKSSAFSKETRFGSMRLVHGGSMAAAAIAKRSGKKVQGPNHCTGVDRYYHASVFECFVIP